MKELKLSEIQKNWDRLRNLINNTFEGERLEKLNKMYDYFEDRMCVAPASGTEHFHNAHVGGYVEHVLHVVDLALKFTNVWEADGATIDFTVEEIIFAALHHDLGKIGDGDKENYVIQTDEWRKNKLFENYTYNPDLDFMLIPDRSLFILQKFGIKVSQKEFLAIRLHDGVYDKANEAYFFSNMESSRQKTSIISVLHSADFLASKVEYDIWKKNGGNSIPKTKKTKSSTGRNVNSSEGLSKMLKNL